jgi:hypothetical protein
MSLAPLRRAAHTYVDDMFDRIEMDYLKIQQTREDVVPYSYYIDRVGTHDRFVRAKMERLTNVIIAELRDYTPDESRPSNQYIGLKTLFYLCVGLGLGYLIQLCID